MAALSMNTQMKDDDPRALLPWYLNGTLSEEESRKVEAWLEQEGAQAEAELSMLRDLREQLQEQEHQGPGELGWHRLQRQIKKERSTERSTPGWYRPALAAALVVVVLQAGLLGQQWFSGADSSDWQTLSAPATQGEIQARFNPDASERQIRELLRMLRLDLVSGPSAQGLYRLRSLASGGQSTAVLVDRLRRQESVVSHAAVEQ